MYVEYENIFFYIIFVKKNLFVYFLKGNKKNNMKYGIGRGKCIGNNIGVIKIKLYCFDMFCFE